MYNDIEEYLCALYSQLSSTDTDVTRYVHTYYASQYYKRFPSITAFNTFPAFERPNLRVDGSTNESTWRNSGEWKSRYSKLYSSRRVSMPKEDEPRRISFMENDTTPYAELLMKLRSSHPIETSTEQDPTDSESLQSSTDRLRSILSRQSEMYPSCTDTTTGSLGRHDTMLLDMVREHNHELQEAQDQPLELPRDDVDDNSSIEPCTHGMSHRFTERSVSRSRFSRISTRRDMDIPSILAFTATDTPPTRLPLGIPAFQKTSATKCEDIPRWSIRRSVCPVCSQKWRDRSTINNIKSSGLKRNALLEMPSIIAPARLRPSVPENTYRPVLPDIGNDLRLSPGLRNTSASWQLTRARRIRTPKLHMPEMIAPSITAPLAQKDLDTRVNNFLLK